MRSIILKCPLCGRFTMSETCPADGTQTRSTVPMRFSPGDRYAKYRRALMEEVMKQKQKEE
ncbi:MAG: ribosome biogenesis protein [Thermoplasmata archaeon]|uniref:Ribosome biogenesis protein Nop10 n=1 Tax=Candidatus Sysuiplasma superficiale TaxID=2823368 RepID=A0A8J7YUY1_9ARCH|nr:ribosome biogenesis protein [Candidatus Sysuiplasma superficiale]MBX8643384.1 ribosome biogenesis protein [Candidatus Sysuiplasma superficiale]MCL4346574.1 ribosome biogenesis protein [Candidatus Thermoplasmatota archaeon]